MLIYITKRLLLAVPTLLVLMFALFVLVQLSPADPARVVAGDNATPEQVAEVRAQMGIDDPLLERYWRYLTSAVQGDLGDSLVSGQPVLANLFDRLPVTLSLVALAIVLTVLISTVLGTLAALNPGRWIDTVTSGIATLLMTMPSFLSALLLVLVFAIQAQVLPAVGYAMPSDGLLEWLRFAILPATSLALVPAALLARQIRGALRESMQADYVRTARAKGMSDGVIVAKHAARNAAIPVVTVLGLEAVYMIGGTVVIERLFAIPGIGSLGVDSVLNGDLITLQGLVLFVGVVVLAVNLLVDLTYGYFDPKLVTR